MKLRFGLSGVVLTLLILPASAVAATPDQKAIHPSRHQFEVVGSFADPDFCGTGQTIEVKAKALLQIRRGVNARRSHGHSRTVFINPATNARVVLKSDGGLRLRRTTEDTGFAIVASLRGAPAVIGTSERRFRSVDPGYVRYVLHFSDEGKFLSSDVVMNELDTETNRAFKRLCRIATDALGL